MQLGVCSSDLQLKLGLNQSTNFEPFDKNMPNFPQARLSSQLKRALAVSTGLNSINATE